MKTTPAPWTVEEDGTSITMQGQVVATAIAPDGASIEERRANANLIAAAPELMARLQLAIRYLEHPDVLAVIDDMAMPGSIVLRQCREAVAHAKGETS